MTFQTESDIQEKVEVAQPRTNFFQPLHNIAISPIVRIAEQARKLEPEFEKKFGEKFIQILIIQKLRVLNCCKIVRCLFMPPKF